MDSSHPNQKNTKEQLEKFYAKKDPWNYKITPDDQLRQDIILEWIANWRLRKALDKGGFFPEPFDRALDIGAGEGWITNFLPADEIHGYEISDKAASRFPENVKRVTEIKGKYDLIIATGVLYKQYDYRWILDTIKKHANGLVLTCNIHNWEKNDLPNMIKDDLFIYRKYIERIAIYDFTSQYRRQKES